MLGLAGVQPTGTNAGWGRCADCASSTRVVEPGLARGARGDRAIVRSRLKPSSSSRRTSARTDCAGWRNCLSEITAGITEPVNAIGQVSRVPVIAIASSFGLFFSAQLLAHEVRPAYLSLREERPGVFAVLWKTPMRGTMRLALEPVFLGKTRLLTPVLTQQASEAAVQTWTLVSDEPLRGQWLRIDGLESTMTDALVRIEFADGTTWIRRFTPREPAAQIPVTPELGAVVAAFFTLGVEHILLGHRSSALRARRSSDRPASRNSSRPSRPSRSRTASRWRWPRLGFVHVPQAPVEAVIALSIVFVAAEIVQVSPGPASASRRARRGSWHSRSDCCTVSASPGRSARSGCPEAHIPLALLFFNLGVESGPTAFRRRRCWPVVALIRRSDVDYPRWVRIGARPTRSAASRCSGSSNASPRFENDHKS